MTIILHTRTCKGIPHRYIVLEGHTLFLPSRSIPCSARHALALAALYLNEHLNTLSHLNHFPAAYVERKLALYHRLLELIGETE